MVDSGGKMEPGNKLEMPHRRDRRKNRQVCPHQSVAKIACDQIRRDRRIKSPSVSPALPEQGLCSCLE